MRNKIDAFLRAYEQEHQITMKVLRAYPKDKSELRPHPKLKTARELAWVFVIERGLGTHIMSNVFAEGMPSGSPPETPDQWDDVLAALEKVHAEFADSIRDYTDEQMDDDLTFLAGPQKMGKFKRSEILWFLLHDQIHHRGQFSVYLRMADAKVPSIYGPSGDEQWI